MTQKDLLYMEDAIKHEENLVTICDYYAEIIEDNNLKSFIKSHSKKHAKLKQKLLNVMEDIANE